MSTYLDLHGTTNFIFFKHQADKKIEALENSNSSTISEDYCSTKIPPLPKNSLFKI
jgi:hypothetical protein